MAGFVCFAFAISTELNTSRRSCGTRNLHRKKSLTSFHFRGDLIFEKPNIPQSQMNFCLKIRST